MEIWKDIIGYEGLYQVSNSGQVKSMARKIVRSDGQNKTIEEKILKWDYLQKDICKLSFAVTGNGKP